MEHSELNQELGKGQTPGKAVSTLGSYLTDLYTMMEVVRYQIKYLEDLRQIFQNSYSSKFGVRPQYNEFEIPFIEGHDEQMPKVMKSMVSVLAEREKFHKELRNWVKELENIRTLVVALNSNNHE